MLAGDFAGYPNGRRLADDVIDIVIQAAEGAAQSGKLVEALAAGDAVDANDVAFGKTFPYIALPNTAAVNTRSGAKAGNGGSSNGGGSSAPTGGADTGFGGTALSSNESVPAAPVGAALAGIVLAGAGVLMLRRRSSNA